MLIGYARVSREEQDLTLQVESLKKHGCAKIFEEKISGKISDRPALVDALSHLREGDTLIVWKLDRLGRTVKSLITLVKELEDKGIGFRSLTDNIDTSTPSGRFFFHIMASLAQMERELIAERTKAGLEIARKLGRVGGRKRKMTKGKINAATNLFKQGMPAKDVASSIEVSIATLYKWIPAEEQIGLYKKRADNN